MTHPSPKTTNRVSQVEVVEEVEEVEVEVILLNVKVVKMFSGGNRTGNI